MAAPIVSVAPHGQPIDQSASRLDHRQTNTTPNNILSSVAVAALVACTTVTEPPASQATVDQHVADAQRIAGEDLKF